MGAIELRGANVAITGAARGIGLKTAAEFLERGASVVIGDIDPTALAEANAVLGDGARGVLLDVSDRESFAAFLTEAEGAGPLDVLVNNAGVMPTGSFLEEPDSVTRSSVGVNLWGPIWGMKLALPGMVDRGHGHVVNVASMMGKFYLPGIATYSGAKYGVVGLSAAVRDELHGTGVTITTVLPSAVETELITGIKLPAALPRVKPEDVAEAIVASCGNRRAEVSVPGWLAHLSPVADLAPSRLTGVLRRFAKHDRALEADPAERAAYEARARHPGSD